MIPDAPDTIFRALANPTRRRILVLLQRHPGSALNDLCRHFDISRIAVMKHLRVLEAAGLVDAHKRGRVRRLYFDVAPIRAIYEGWAREYGALWSDV